MEEFTPAGGTAVVYRWLTSLRDPDETELWSALDHNLRLCFAQGWLMTTGRDDPKKRNKRAASLARGDHKLFAKMVRDMVEHWRHAYRDMNFEPALIGATDLVGPDMELVMFTRDEFAGPYSAGARIPAHSFITHYVEGAWKIAATSRRLPVPGWPPTEQEVSGLLGSTEPW